ncbi:MAG: helix-turn-helix domain-containing protein [Candidatus Thermoplasmatota archaeon]
MRFASLLVKIPGNWIGCLTSSCDLSVRILKCVPKNGTGGQSLLQIDTDPGVSQEELVERIRGIEPNCNVQLTAAGPGRHIGTVELERCAACRLMADSGCFMDSASNREGGMMQWNVIAPNAAALRDLVSKVRDLGCQIEVEKISVLRTASELTVAQERVLQMAFELGYFEIPKKITLDKLAKRLEISKATLDVMLRRAQRKLVASHIGELC